MAEIEVRLPEDRNVARTSFSLREMEEKTQMYNKHELCMRMVSLEYVALMQYKPISHIVKAYESQENELNKKLPEITMNLVLNHSCDTELQNEAPENFRTNLEKIERNYRLFNDEFVVEMNKWLEQRRKTIENLQKTLHMLHWIKQTTSVLALVSSVMDITQGIGTLLFTLFTVDMKPKYSPLMTCVVGGLSVTGSVFALSYFKHTAEDIFRGLREEKYLLRDLLIIDRRGNYVDEDVEDLFPESPDLSLVNQIAQDIDENFVDDTSWKHYLSFAILLPNFKKNKRLMNDRKFLASVKLFVESPVAKIWLYRIKLRKLLDEMVTNLENQTDKKVFDGNEVLNQAAINLYPIFFPLFVDSRNLEKLRFIFSSMAAISAVVNLTQSDVKGFDDIRKMSDGLLKDYKNLKNFNQDFTNEYD